MNNPENNTHKKESCGAEVKLDAKAVIDCIDDGIFITDGEGTVIEANKRGLGSQKREDIIGKNMADLIKAGIYENSIALKVIEEKKPLTMIQHEETDLLTTAMPHIVDGAVKMVVCCEREIDELEIIKKELKDAKEKNDNYERELQYMRSQITQDIGLVAETAEMKRVVDLALTAASFDSRVLIEGETGAGKEVIAKLIYRQGKRYGKPFFAVNCGAIPETLLESELFGYERGAFTGADRSGKKGFFELADGGVLFLDEIGEISESFQVKLLRALQENEIMRIGGKTPIKLNVQIIAATNKNLMEKVSQGSFRSDLYYRLNVFPIRIPPLRGRFGDIRALVNIQLAKFNEKYSMDKKITLDAMSLLQNYKWPGNIRELENVIERLVLTCSGGAIKDSHIMQIIFAGEKGEIAYSDKRSFEEMVAGVEREILIQCIKEHKTTAAMERVLGISRSTLNRKLKRYGLRNML